jgi:hypothetical protein
MHPTTTNAAPGGGEVREVARLGVLLAILTAVSSAQCAPEWTAGFSQRGLSGGVSALQVCDLGDGPHLYASGGMIRDHNQLTNHIVKWNGSYWEPLGAGIEGGYALAAANLGGAGTVCGPASSEASLGPR